jgi:hypothetical protein
MAHPMQRSSIVIIIVAVILLILASLPLLSRLNKKAPTMDRVTAQEWLENACTIAQNRDIDGLMNLCAPNARIFGRDKEQCRLLLAEMYRQAGSEPIKIDISNVNVSANSSTATVDFTADVAQMDDSSEIDWIKSHYRLILQKREITHWFGLYHTEQWQVIEAYGRIPED